jgi:hypothetical protein
MKTVITQLVKQKKELENELKNKNNTKPKPPTPSSLTLKKPSLLTSKPISNINTNILTKITAKEVLTLKTPVFIKFD